MADSRSRKPHAALAPSGRWPKAEKIRRLLALPPPLSRLRLLEIGTGSGVIAHYFAVHSGLDCEVEAVDVVDQRQIVEGYRFSLVDGALLPFEANAFDVVISNHVVEHLGGIEQQLRHVSEIARILRPGGKAYLATPNRWQVVEPHFRVAFLSWLPRTMRSAYLRLHGKGDFYDCEPLSMPEIERLFVAARLRYENLCVPAIRMMLDTERAAHWAVRVAGIVPDRLLASLRRFSPTHVYLLKPIVKTSA